MTINIRRRREQIPDDGLTNQVFDRILVEILREYSQAELISLLFRLAPDELREEFNNDIIDNWEARQDK